MQKAHSIIPISNEVLWMILIPNKGRLVSTNGNKAQCMAQATEVTTPNASQLILIFILAANILKNATLLQTEMPVSEYLCCSICLR